MTFDVKSGKVHLVTFNSPTVSDAVWAASTYNAVFGGGVDLYNNQTGELIAKGLHSGNRADILQSLQPQETGTPR